METHRYVNVKSFLGDGQVPRRIPIVIAAWPQRLYLLESMFNNFKITIDWQDFLPPRRQTIELRFDTLAVQQNVVVNVQKDKTGYKSPLWTAFEKTSDTSAVYCTPRWGRSGLRPSASRQIVPFRGARKRLGRAAGRRRRLRGTLPLAYQNNVASLARLWPTLVKTFFPFFWGARGVRQV